MPGRLIISESNPAAGQDQSTNTGTSRAGDAVFSEPEVERILYAHLRRSGYRVREKVRVPNGIVDAVATRDGSQLVIEVKGEDKGGYGSAQMNFQMAIGQISSRMSDPVATYAVAFPISKNYLRVLRTFRHSQAFELLNLILYAVGRNGEVLTIPAHAVAAWIESLVSRGTPDQPG